MENCGHPKGLFVRMKPKAETRIVKAERAQATPERIRTLYRHGHPVRFIVKQFGIPKEEVERIVGVTQNKVQWGL